MSSNKLRFWMIILLLLVSSSLISACVVTTKQATIQTSASNPLATTSASALPLPGPNVDFPLALHTTWVFQVTRYETVPVAKTITTTSVATETVVEVKSVEPYFVAKIHRDQSAAIPAVDSEGEQDSVSPPGTSSDYWLVVNGNRLYRQETTLDLPNLGSSALLEVVFPLQVGNQWYQSDEKAKLHPTPVNNDFMLRQVKEVGDVVVPAGHFSDCFLLEEVWAGTTFETRFCPNVGIVEQKVDHQGTLEGIHQVLLSYQPKN